MTEPLIVIDVGVRGGFQKHWERLGDGVRLIGFDADADECARLQQQYAGQTGRDIVAAAVGAEAGRLRFMKFRHEGGSSFYPHEPSMQDLLAIPREGAILESEAEVDVITLDDWCANNGVGRVDALKLDVQGHELEILRGAEATLANVRAIEAEVGFNQTIQGAPLFGDLDRWLRERGFLLWRFRELTHYPLAGGEGALPTVESVTYWDHDPVTFLAAPGMLAWGNAYYVRREMIERDLDVPVEIRLRDAAVAEALGFGDIALWNARNAGTAVQAGEPGAAGDEPAPEFSELLHGLRERELQRLPADARTVLHGGAAGSWYFRWFEDNYPGQVERHIGVEAFAPRPDDLPANVEWLARTFGDMGPVPDGSVDMVFGGQVIEHLWPEDIAGLLLESYRVLRPDGALVLDSPNRRVTEAIGWQHPQHTVELSVDEAAGLLRTAGFDVDEVRGILLGYDRETHAFLGIGDLAAEPMGWQDRAIAAADRPDDSFIWWIRARRAERGPDPDALRAMAHELFERFRAGRLGRLRTPLDVVHRTGAPPAASAPATYGGPLVHGPYFPVDAGRWRATFTLRRGPGSAAPTDNVVWVDATSDVGEAVHAHRDVTAAELADDGSWTEITLDFELAEMTMGIELRAFSRGVVPTEAQLGVSLERVG